MKNISRIKLITVLTKMSEAVLDEIHSEGEAAVQKDPSLSLIDLWNKDKRKPVSKDIKYKLRALVNEL